MTRTVGAWALWGAILGCAPEPATAIRVRIQTDIERGELDRVSVRAERILGDPIVARDFPVRKTSAGDSFPGEVVLVPGDPDDPRPVQVDVGAHFREQGETRDFTRRAIVSFHAGRTTVLHVVLARWCVVPANRDRCSARGATCGWTRETGPDCEPVEQRQLPDALRELHEDRGYNCPICRAYEGDIPRDRCVDFRSNDAHCGNCETRCASGESCLAGRCGVCVGGGVVCDHACRDVQTDRDHCGACGRACAPGFVCVRGACATSCEAETVACAGVCRDLRSDLHNCGGCGRDCEDRVCRAGKCVPR